MNEPLVREVVREAIARHLAGGERTSPAAPAPPMAPHASHARYHLINTTDACLIEPAAACNHCGYCESHGH